MAWTVAYDDTLRAISVKLFGSLDGSELHGLTSAAIALQKEQGILDVLVDAIELEFPPPLVDIYDLPAEQYIAEHLTRKVRIAVVLPKVPHAREAAQFYETVCRNRGWSVRSFLSRDEAAAWLQGAGSPNKPDAGDAL